MVKIARRAYGRELKHEGLLSSTPTDKVKNLKVKEMSGAKIKQIAEDARITNDSDSKFGATSAYLNQAEAMIDKLNTLMMTKGGGPWPSSVGIHTASVALSGTSKVYAENCYLNTLTAQSETAPNFQGIIRVHGIGITNASGADITYTVVLKGKSGDGKGGDEGQIYLAGPVVLAGGRFATLDLSSVSNGIYLGAAEQSYLEFSEISGNAAYTANIYYSVYSYGGSMP